MIARDRTRARLAWTCAILVALAAPAGAGLPAARVGTDGFLHRVAQRFAPRPAAPVLVPPVPVVVAWRPQKLQPSLDLGAPLLALAAGDLDGDGKAELYAVTAREVIAFAVSGTRVRELGRMAFSGEPAAHRPRDPVGAAVIDGARLIASSSAFARTLVVSWQGKALAGAPGDAGIALCAGEIAQLAAGRDYFGDGATATYGARCTALVAADGHPLHVRGELSTAGKLAVTVERCAGSGAGAPCAHEADYAYAHVGVGFDFADLDRDGQPELVFAAAGAPGERDELRAITLGDDERHAKWKKAFSAGGIAAIAAGDFERRGPVAIAAVRLIGSTRVDLWRVN